MTWVIRLMTGCVALLSGIVLKHSQVPLPERAVMTSGDIGGRTSGTTQGKMDWNSKASLIVDGANNNRDQYQAISQRNCFDLGSITNTSLNPQKQGELVVLPKQDLILNGVFNAGNIRVAMFILKESSGSSSVFSLNEGGQNDLLEVRSVGNGLVKAVLKRPVMRIRNAGVEVILAVESPSQK